MRDPTLLRRLESFYDAAPRVAGADADAEDHGPLTLFVGRPGGFRFYARPRVGAAEAPTPDDIDAVRVRQRELGVPEAFEWVDETTPGLLDMARASGLEVLEAPLMVLDGPLRAVHAPAGVIVRRIAADAPEAELRAVDGVGEVAFANGGVEPGAAGAGERDAAAAQTRRERVAAMRTTLAAGTLVRAGADDAGGGGLLSTGAYQHAEGVAEIVGVGTLPSARRRGLGAAVTGALARHALDAGIATIFISAGSEDVARVYGRLGFERRATACIAEPR